METLKKPETIITLINSTALLGVSVYFHRRINTLEQEMAKHSGHLTSTINTVKDMQITKEHIKQLAHAIRELNGTAAAEKNEIAGLKSALLFQNNQVKELQKEAKESNADCELTKTPYHIQQLLSNNYQQGRDYGSRQYQGHQSPSPHQGYQQSPVQQYQGHQGPNPRQGYQQYQGPASQQGYQQISNHQYQGHQTPAPQQGYQQIHQYQGNGYQTPAPQQGYQMPREQDLIDMGINSFGGQQQGDDVDSQLDAIEAARRARQNGGLQDLNLQF
jgi:hypothetical protein